MSTPPHPSEQQTGSGSSVTVEPPNGEIIYRDNRSKSRKIIDELTYPHGIHPALVPGVGVEDRKLSFATDKVVFLVTAALIVGFILWGILSIFIGAVLYGAFGALGGVLGMSLFFKDRAK